MYTKPIPRTIRRLLLASLRKPQRCQRLLAPSFQSKNAKSLGAGKLLVASRNLGDPRFAKTVILLARYYDHGVLGLILNRRTDVPLSRVLESPKAAKDRSDPVYVGGPLEMPEVFGLLQSPGKLEGAEHVFDGVYLIATKSLFEQTISTRPDPGVFHVYLGYAGWTQDQLRQEVGLGAWFIFPAETSTVFNADPDSLWLEMIRKTELQLVRSEPGDADPRTGVAQVADPISDAITISPFADRAESLFENRRPPPH